MGKSTFPAGIPNIPHMGGTALLAQGRDQGRATLPPAAPLRNQDWKVKDKQNILVSRSPPWFLPEVSEGGVCSRRQNSDGESLGMFAGSRYGKFKNSTEWKLFLAFYCSQESERKISAVISLLLLPEAHWGLSGGIRAEREVWNRYMFNTEHVHYHKSVRFF